MTLERTTSDASSTCCYCNGSVIGESQFLWWRESRTKVWHKKCCVLALKRASETHNFNKGTNMLVLGRKVKDSVILTTPDGTSIIISVERIEGNSIRLGIDAPNCIDIQRGELVLDIAKDGRHG